MPKKVIIAGFGDAGKLVFSEIGKDNRKEYVVLCFLDDDPAKLGQEHFGAKVLGRISDAPRLAKELGAGEIIIAIPSAKGSDIRRIIGECTVNGVSLKILPSLFEIIRGNVEINKIRPVKADDLLGRKTAEFDIMEVEGIFRGKRVLVTGGAGSIGTELAKKLVQTNPAELFLLDIDENGLYFNLVDLRRDNANVKVEVVVANIREREKVFRIFNRLKPQIVFHAAASKQVPIVEQNVAEGVKNNILGTKNVVDAAIENSAERFVFISTDKAVSPSSIMGSTKRVAEWICQNAQPDSKGTKIFIARFGNVFGSKGSVIPLFMKQIEERREITITDKKMTRYFMSIEEAVALLLRVCSFQRGGTYFFDMGEQIRIYDVGVELIKMQGLKPGVDVKILETGLRPGEKISERLITENESKSGTSVENIMEVIAGTNSWQEVKLECNKIIERLELEGEHVIAKEIRELAAPIYRKTNAI